MPELPEVETLRRGVHGAFAGRRVEEMLGTGARTLRRHPDPAAAGATVAGRTLAGVDRHGKYLILRLDGPEVVVVHLGMSGQLLRAGAEEPLPRHTHALWRFEGGEQLRFVDPRTFGEVFVTRAGPSGAVAELSHLGPDALCGIGGERSLDALLAGRRTRLKPLLMDQRVIAGIGNIYADEILFAAGLRADRPAGDLSASEVRRLAEAMEAVLADAVAHRGSSLADEQYRDLDGALGAYQQRHSVYAREGLPCTRCGAPVVRVRWSGRSSFSCVACQR